AVRRFRCGNKAVTIWSQAVTIHCPAPHRPEGAPCPRQRAELSDCYGRLSERSKDHAIFIDPFGDNDIWVSDQRVLFESAVINAVMPAFKLSDLLHNVRMLTDQRVRHALSTFSVRHGLALRTLI